MGTSDVRSMADDTVAHQLATVLPSDGRPWYRKGHLVRLNVHVLSLIMLCSANGYDGTLMNGLQALPRWNEFMGMPAGAWLGFINAVYWISNGVSFAASAWISNKYGRKPGIYIGYVFLVAGIILQTAANNEGAFIAARALVGSASGWYTSGAPILINEIAFPTHRPIAAACYQCGFYLGSLISAWVTFATRDYGTSWDWRLPSLLQILLPALALPGIIMAPESPRWLASVDRVEDAKQFILEHHAGGDIDSPLVSFETEEIINTIKAEQEAYASTSYADLVKTKGNRWRLLISVTLGIFSQWSGNGVVSYYLALVLQTVGITSVTHQTLISALLQVWNLIWAVAASVSVERLGRRPLFLSSAVIMLVSYIVITGLSGSFANTGNAPVGIAVIPFLFIFFLGYDIALTPLVVSYPVEIWPYRLRSRGFTASWVSGICAAVFNMFVNPIALQSIGWKYYFVFIVFLVAFLLTAYFCYPETRGRTLEQMAFIFDGDDAAAAAELLPAESKTGSVPEEEKQKLEKSG
ncbi:general substrate transporter [Microdochium trichocladiopsis]|uniref:General substrate transporter n=1 Tax=Microdochium trichocladiopsis TaxID=1682393 RepID=A0A9P8XZG7_9PEZI|nr:general substrate transporter [Microdochium trichocladiopsis]KAH7025701.1 general substrate transporter [Microdochium trichocladiopsis]